MDRPFRDDDREKRVVTNEGHQLGTVREVDEDRATVDRSDDDDSLTDEIKDLLGWDDEAESHELRREDIDRYEDDRFYVRARR